MTSKTPQAETAKQAVATPVASRGRRRYVPPQHGAWAMLSLPYLAGLIAAGYRWPDLPLLGAWLTGYLLTYYTFTALKARRVTRYRHQLALYATLCLPLAVLTVAVRPALIGYAAIYVPLLALSAWYAWRRHDRALVNDIALVVQSCVMVFVVANVAGHGVTSVARVFVLCLTYLVGTILHVKAMIRGRGNRAAQRWSIAYHVAGIAVAAWISPWAAVVFIGLLARALWLPGRSPTPAQIGAIEVVMSAAVLAVAALA